MSKQIQLKVENEEMYPNPYWPVGSIFLSVVNTNPTNWFGGTWELIAQGRTLVGVDTSDADFNTVKKTGGEKTHTLTTNEIPQTDIWAGNTQAYMRYSAYSGGSELNGVGSWGTSSDVKLTTVGGNQPHNNLQPYFTCYIWCRTA